MVAFFAAFACLFGWGFLEFDTECLGLFGDDLDFLFVVLEALFGGGEDVFSGGKLDLVWLILAGEIGRWDGGW